MDISKNKLIQFYTTMQKIRMFEEKVIEMLYADEIICPSHMYTGQEAIATGVCSNLDASDYAFGTYRSHGFYIAKGGSLNDLMAELLCKETGCSRGKGGSMHVVAPEIGILGTSAIVGGTIPLAVGTAMASKMQKNGKIVASFFGDGATDEGVFYESINFAAVHKLPIVFVCENNHYSTHLPLRMRQPVDNIYQRIKGLNIPAVHVDGNNVTKVYQTANKAVKHVRANRGPFFMECNTYRWRSHVGPWEDIGVGFRTKKEVESWLRKCCIKRLERSLVKNKMLSNKSKEQILEQVSKEIAQAYDYACKSHRPDKSELEKDVYKK